MTIIDKYIKMTKYSWDKAEQENYKTALTALSRQSIVDGELLNKNLESFAGRDAYVHDQLEPLMSSLADTIEVISDNSAKNWNNDLLTGFSSISTDATILKMSKCNDGPVNLQFNALDAELDENDNIVLSIPSFYFSSYMLCASATLSPDGSQYIAKYDGSNQPNTVLGSNNILTNYPGLSINNSTTQNVGLAVNNSTAFNGIAINDSTSPQSDYPGISINGSKTTLLSFALNNSTVSDSYEAYFQFACNNAYVQMYGFAIDGDAKYHSIAIGSTAYNNAVTYKDSSAYNYSIGLFNSTANICSIAAYNSSAYYNAVSLFDSSASYDSITLYRGFSVVDDILDSYNVAMYNSTAVKSNVVSLYQSIAESNSLAVFNSTATHNSFAFNDSIATMSGLSMCNSTATLPSFAFNRSYGSFPYCLSVNNSYSYDYGIAFSNCTAAHTQAIALFNTTAMGNYNSKTIAAYSIKYSLPIVRNITGGNFVNDITLYDSTLGYTTEHFPSTVFTGYQCDIPVGSAVSGKFGIEQTITKYDSMNAGNLSMSYYSSIVGAGVSASLAMYDSVVDANAMVLAPDGTASILICLTNNNVAMYGSTITGGKNHIVLWNNNVTIEERGSINDNIFIDMNIQQNIAVPDYSLFFGSTATNTATIYYLDKHIFIIA